MKKFEEFIPDNSISTSEAYQRTTRLAVCAHQDDVEFIAYKGILDCYDSDSDYFSAVVVTNGAGSPRAGKYASCSDSDMVDIRYEEQKQAARIGKYSVLDMLGYTSSEVKDPTNVNVPRELCAIISRCAPEIVYTHNIFDRHDTHTAVALRTIVAIKNMPKELRPKKLLGGEMWRSLDWLPDEKKIIEPIPEDDGLAMRLMSVFDSQIAGGKNYAVAVDNRRVSNATLGASHKVDSFKRCMYFLDMTPLIQNDDLTVKEFMDGIMTSFTDEINKQISYIYRQ